MDGDDDRDYTYKELLDRVAVLVNLDLEKRFVGQRVFDHVLACASGEVQAKAEETGHREFQVWAERAVSL